MSKLRKELERITDVELGYALIQDCTCGSSDASGIIRPLNEAKWCYACHAINEYMRRNGYSQFIDSKDASPFRHEIP